MWLGSARIGATSGSGSSRQLAGAAATLDGGMYLVQAKSQSINRWHRCFVRASSCWTGHCMGKIDTVGNVTNVLLRAVVAEACLAKRKCILFSQMG